MRHLRHDVGPPYGVAHSAANGLAAPQHPAGAHVAVIVGAAPAGVPTAAGLLAACASATVAGLLADGELATVCNEDQTCLCYTPSTGR